jgi:hypothetical protein
MNVPGVDAAVLRTTRFAFRDCRGAFLLDCMISPCCSSASPPEAVAQPRRSVSNGRG